MSLLSGDEKVCTEQVAPPSPKVPGDLLSRRIRGRCYLCGDPVVGKWFCAAHLWAGDANHLGVSTNGMEHVTRYHAYWLKRFTPQQIVELASYL